MKCTIPEISWHNRDPILSVDIQPVQNEFYKLASGGTDCHVLIWNLKICQNGSVDFHLVSDLTRHQRSVNVVRWSPSGTYLASGDDDANIIIWHVRTEHIPLFEEETNNEECWVVNKILRGHKEDVYDISWSPCEAKLISGSIDNTAILWDFNKGQVEFILSDHKGFVQGVNWDPKGEFLATISSDRMCRIFDNTGKHVRARIQKGHVPVPESHALHHKEVKYFHDDTFKSYFRRLNFSPDGNLLIVPSGNIDVENYNEIRNTTYIFSINNITQPVALLPSPKQITIAVRCCPILFKLHLDGPSAVIDLPYRMVIAVATDSDIILYDTQQVTPFAHFRKVHYTRITDLTWSLDGLLLIASSTDGFCTLITFEHDEIGTQYVKEDSEPEENVLDISGCEELSSTNSILKDDKEVVKKPNILEQWTVRTPQKDLNKVTNKNISQTSNTTTDKVNELIPKRIIPVRIGDSSKGVKTYLKKEKATSDFVVIKEDSIDTISSDEEENVSRDSNILKDELMKSNSGNHKNSIRNFFPVTSNNDPIINKTVQKNEVTTTNSAKTNSLDVIELSDSDTNMSTPDNLPINETETDENKFVEKENVKTNIDSPDRSKLSSSTNPEVKINAVKTPRRIPFVTLASPKRKKKE